jgi:hypothetical protein
MPKGRLTLGIKFNSQEMKAIRMTVIKWEPYLHAKVVDKTTKQRELFIYTSLGIANLTSKSRLN